MRVVDVNMFNAVDSCRQGSVGNNTEVEVREYCTGKLRAEVKVLYHGHPIACIVKGDGKIEEWWIDTHGFHTQSTIRRINIFVQLCVDIPYLKFKIRDGVTHWFWHGQNMGKCCAMNKRMFLEWTEGK